MGAFQGILTTNSLHKLKFAFLRPNSAASLLSLPSDLGFAWLLTANAAACDQIRNKFFPVCEQQIHKNGLSVFVADVETHLAFLTNIKCAL